MTAPALLEAVTLEGHDRTWFNEEMRGWFAPFSGQTYGEADRAGRANGAAGSFLLTVVSDVEQMVADPNRRSPAFGCVILPSVDPGPLRVMEGWLDLFVDAGPDAVEMRYGLLLRAVGGEPYYLRGVKEIVRRAWYPTVLADTTTLYVDLYAGNQAAGDPLLRGILRMGPLAINAQGLSFRGRGGPLGLRAIFRFARYYISRVTRVYFGPRRPPSRV